jgi:hypothetical protein
VNVPKKPKGILPLFTRLSIARSTSALLSDIVFYKVRTRASAVIRRTAWDNRRYLSRELELITHHLIDGRRRSALPVRQSRKYLSACKPFYREYDLFLSPYLIAKAVAVVPSLVGVVPVQGPQATVHYRKMPYPYVEDW